MKIILTRLTEPREASAPQQQPAAEMTIIDILVALAEAASSESQWP